MKDAIGELIGTMKAIVAQPHVKTDWSETYNSERFSPDRSHMPLDLSGVTIGELAEGYHVRGESRLTLDYATMEYVPASRFDPKSLVDTDWPDDSGRPVFGRGRREQVVDAALTAVGRHERYNIYHTL